MSEYLGEGKYEKKKINAIAVEAQILELSSLKMKNHFSTTIFNLRKMILGITS